MRDEKKAVPGLTWLRWMLRMLVIFTALYLETFSFDVFKSGFPFWKTVLAFVLHSIPAIVLIFVLFISFKWEHIAGFSLMCFALMGTLPAGPPDESNLFTYIIIGITTLIGILFVLNYFVFGGRKNADEL